MKVASIILALFLQFAGFAQIKVVIDPGHGGHDPGHCGAHANHDTEKEINLKVALFLGGYIEKYLQNVEIIYTRTADNYPTLDERVNLANTQKADYFISIHCNGSDNPAVRGTETHVHSLESKKAARFAQNIEDEFSNRAGRKSRGVKDERDLQHSIQVLKYTVMTSVLVECGFISNVEEAAYLNSTYGQEIIASAIFRALRTTLETNHSEIAFRKSATSTSQIASTATENKSGSSNSSSNYSIQIASSKQAISTDDYFFRKSGLEVSRKELNTTSAYKFVYYAGNFDSKESAEAALKELKSKGFADAILVKA